MLKDSGERVWPGCVDSQNIVHNQFFFFFLLEVVKLEVDKWEEYALNRLEWNYQGTSERIYQVWRHMGQLLYLQI